jgi:hypothetical protein
MGNIIITHLTSAGVPQKQYKVEGGQTVDDTLTQSTPQLTIPKSAPDRAILNTLFGQKGQQVFTFLIAQRSDDYTNGSGTPGDGTPRTQKNFLKEDIFKASGYHIITDENGDIYQGRIIDLSIKRQSDEPLMYFATLTFSEGVAPI